MTAGKTASETPDVPLPFETFLLDYGSWRGITDPISRAKALVRLDESYQAAHAISRFHYCWDGCERHGWRD